MSLGVVMLLLTATLLALLPGGTLAADNELIVGRTRTAMMIDGKADEAAWAATTMTRVVATKGAVNVDVEMKALYDEQYLYMLASWSDQSHSVMPNQWLRTAGKWTSIGHEEDQLAILWDAEDKIVGFDQNRQGCMALDCHADGWETKNAGEWGDLWQWHAARTNPSSRADNIGWMDDLSVDTTGIVPDDFTGSKIWAPNSLYATDDNASTVAYTAGDHPIYEALETNPPPHPDPNFLFDGFIKNIIDPEAFDDQTTIPGWVLSRPTGNRADIEAKAVYDGVMKKWTLEIKRKLVTGHEKDVQFSDVLKEYNFGLAVFDNQAGGMSTHYNSALVTMKFAVPDLKVEPITVSSTSPVLGSEINVTVNLTNAGSYAKGFTLGLYLDDTTGEPIKTKPYTEMEAGAVDLFNLSWDTSGVPIGKHKLVVKADTADVNKEHDKANNVAELEVWVYPPITEFTSSKSKPEDGKKVTLTAVINNPTTANMTVTVIFTDKDKVLSTDTVEVPAKGVANVTYEWKATKVGKHTIAAEIQGAEGTRKEVVVNVQEASPVPSAAFALVAIIAGAAAFTVRRRTGNP